MIDFIKTKQEKEIKNILEFIKAKDELFKKIYNLKMSLPTKIKLIEDAFKIKEQELEKELIEQKAVSAEFWPKRTKLIEDEFKTKINSNKEEMTKKTELIKAEFKNKIEKLEKEFQEISKKITDTYYDVRIMERKIKYFQEKEKEKSQKKFYHDKINKQSQEEWKQYKKMVREETYQFQEAENQIVSSAGTNDNIHKQLCNKISSFEQNAEMDIDSQPIDLQIQQI